MLIVIPCIISKWNFVHLLGVTAVGSTALDTKEETVEVSRKRWEAATAGGLFSPVLQCRRWRGESLVVCHKNAPEKVSFCVYHLSFSASVAILYVHVGVLHISVGVINLLVLYLILCLSFMWLQSTSSL